MADFVAVIRRAVDGLTDNTPEMRLKVYEKARTAVVRQLENMNPRPPEAMFKRQLDKLDAAIRQVEEENSEAVPADAADTAPAEAAASAGETLHQDSAPEQGVAPLQEEAVHHEPADEIAAVHSEPVHEAPAAHAEPVHHEAAAEEPARHEPAQHEPETQAEAAAYPEPAHAEPEPVPAEAHEAQPAFEPVQDGEPFHAAEPVHHEEPAYGEETVHHEQPADQHPDVAAARDAGWEGREPQDSAPAHADAAHDDPLLSHFEPVREPAIRYAANRVMEEPLFGAESEIPGDEPGRSATQPVHPASDRPAEMAAREEAPVAQPASAMPDWGVDIDREPETAADHPEADTGDAPRMPRAALTETDVAAGFNDFLKSEFATPAVKPPPARKEPESEFSWDAPFDDLPDLPKPVAFEQALHARQEELAKAPERRADPRAELEDLIGYTPADAETDAGTPGEKLPPEVSRAMSKLEGKSYKVHKKNQQRFNPIPIAFGVAGALLVAGGAYALYAYRDDVSTLVATYMPADTAPATSETRAVGEKPGDQSKSVTVKAEDTSATEQATAPAAEEKPTEVASLDTNIVPTKFTQRLLADGTETETDAAKIPIDPSLNEGKTIAGQTEVASSNPDTAVTEQTAEKPGLAVTQKMFLYEERLGGSPVAVPGTVSWSLKTDTTASGGKEQPMVEATVEVPERKLKAVISFKRNSDPSLPASHIIELVFDLPADFSEGNVESVQRIAFKETEQDRGNGLIAVPAKITDDFHMIALNDDAEARKVNVELMKTRSWIDIPVVYRNNRRALFTFEKGSTGTEAFDKALAQWAALGPTANN